MHLEVAHACRWADQEDSDSDGAGEARASAEQRQRAVNGFLRESLTAVLLAATDTAFSAIAKYALAAG